MSLEQQLSKLLNRFVGELTALVKQAERDRLAAALGVLGAAPTRRTRVASPARPVAAKRPNIKPCRVPGCGKPSKGPRFKYLCEDHRGLPAAELARLLGDAGGQKSASNGAAKPAGKPGRKAASAAGGKPARKAAKPGRKAAAKGTKGRATRAPEAKAAAAEQASQ